MRLVQRGFSVTVFGEEPVGGDMPQHYQGVELRYVKAPDLGPLTTLVFDARCLIKCRKGYDVVYMLGYGAAIFCLLTRWAGVQTWINMDGVEWKRSKWSWLAKIWFRLMEWTAVHAANRVIADADGIRQHLEERHGHLEKCSVIAYGAYCVEDRHQSDLLNEIGVRDGEYYLVVCRLEPENHVLEIIEGYLSTNSCFPLLIVGDHNASTEYTRQLVSLSGDRVRFIGAVYDQSSLTSLRFSCRAYFHGHSVGGTNPSLLEAMGAGNVVIAHDNTFNREVLGKTGLFFAGVDQVAGRTKLCDQMSDEERRQIASEVTERIRTRYTWEAITSQYEDLINRQTAIT